MGLTVKSDDKPVMVFRKDKEYNGITFPTYCISVSSKDKEGNWVNGYIDVMFKKGIGVDDQTKIFIKNAFPVVSKGKDRNFVKLMITDFDYESAPAVDKDGFMKIPEGIQEELPFK
jgi:hypothetical protein